jgi:hypothetical protein
MSASNKGHMPREHDPANAKAGTAPLRTSDHNSGVRESAGTADFFEYSGRMMQADRAVRRTHHDNEEEVVEECRGAQDALEAKPAVSKGEMRWAATTASRVLWAVPRDCSM